MSHPFKRADRLVFYAIVALGLVLLLMPRGSGRPAAVVVEGADGFRVVVPLSEERTVEVPGPLGETIVEVREGTTRVVSSPCPDKVCIAMGTASRPGEALVCVPNGVVVRIDGGRRGGPDATTR